MNKRINIEKIIEYYDIPQLFIGKDTIGTRYLCLLFNDSGQHEYLSIQISMKMLSLFLSGKKDLRELFLNPELEDGYFIAVANDNGFYLREFKDRPIESMLPSKRYYLNKNK